MLVIEDLVKRYGGVTATNHCSLSLEPGTITGLIGPNGSGKTTLFDQITGLTRPDSGRIMLHGRELQSLPPHHVTRLGLSRTFQLTRVFPSLSVLENMVVASFGLRDREAVVRAVELLERFGLHDKRGELAGSLSYGQRKLLEFARALMNDPRLVLLDEPFAGVNPLLEKQMVDKIAELNAEGMTFFIIDHEMEIIMSLCDPIIVIHQGEVLAQGDAAVIRANRQVIEAYFGTSVTGAGEGRGAGRAEQ